MDRGRMLSLTYDPAGERFHSPAYSARHLSASPAPGRTERVSLSPCASFGLFDPPFLFPKGFYR